MGDILFIRVTANTFSEEKMQKRWSGLCNLAFPNGLEKAGGFETGVLALIAALYDGINFKLFDSDKLDIIKDNVLNLKKFKESLEEALANQDVPKAKKLSNDIEYALDDAEKLLRDEVRL